MQIKRLSTPELLNKYVSENGEAFETDGKELYCKICKKNISFDTKQSINRHLNSKKHNQILAEKSSGAINKTQKEELIIAELLNKYVSENIETFETDGESLLCKLCKKSVHFDKKSSVDRHLKTQAHLYNYAENIEKAYLKADKNLSEEKDGLSEAKEDMSEAKDDFSSCEKCEDFCRTCMKQFSKANQKCNKQNITETPEGYQQNTSIMEILEIIQPQIKVELVANLPTLICSDCIEKLMVSYEFIEMYQNADKKLRRIFAEFGMNKNYNNLIETQICLEEIAIPADFKTEKSDNEIEQININGFENEELKESDTEWSEFIDEPRRDSPNDADNNDTSILNPISESSDDDRVSKRSCLNVSPKSHNSDDVTKKVFKSFFQPEKNDDGSLTCQMCEAVLDGVLPWREHIRQTHLEEKTKRAYHRRTNEPRKTRTPKAHRKFLPNEKGLYQCEYCEKSYPKYLFYRRHLRIHTEGTHLCIECGKSFSNVTSYNSHMLRHKGEKKFKCSKCPKSFVCPSDLYGHMMTHTTNKPYVCDVCGSAFRMPYQLKNHSRVHTGIKKYKCEYCDMRFKSRANQVCHIRTHTGEKPFHCIYCERVFAQSGDCVKHMRHHVGDNNVYMCDLCPLRFPLVRDLRTHVASHKDDNEETRERNLQARKEAEKHIRIKLGSKKTCIILKTT